MSPADPADPADGEAVLRVVRGNPTPEEVAALVAVLLEPEGDASTPARPVRRVGSAWADPAHVLRHAQHPVPARRSRVYPGA
jgi:acyl-CoA carboxylase epsilon subunit